MKNRHKIIELNKLWYQLIGPEHHKDRDCHFRVVETFSYGDRISYSIEHYGYLMDDYLEDFSSREEAETALIELIAKGIKEWAHCWTEEGLSDADKDEYYRKVNEILNT